MNKKTEIILSVLQQGFIKVKNIKSAKQISTDEPVTHEFLEEHGIDGVMKILVNKLISKIIEENLLYIEVTEEFETMNKVFHSALTLCPPGTKFQQVTDEHFVVKGENFTEEELIKAVRSTFPERFI